MACARRSAVPDCSRSNACALRTLPPRGGQRLVGRVVLGQGGGEFADAGQSPHVAELYPDDDAAMEHYAVDAAPDPRRFQQGLRLAHQGGTGHLTALGHSYGTTVVGYTARNQAGIVADEVIFVASPGVGVDHASELYGVRSDHVWATTAAFGIIPDFWYRNDPVDTEFGARQF